MRANLHNMRQRTLAGGLAAIAAAPLVAAALLAPATIPTTLAECPAGDDLDPFTGRCVPYIVPNSPATGCPAGVGGSECNVQNQPISQGPNMPAPVPPQQPEQELAEVVTPGY
jgi:hypothetical protein